jgi:hypothetical protein
MAQEFADDITVRPITMGAAYRDRNLIAEYKRTDR